MNKCASLPRILTRRIVFFFRCVLLSSCVVVCFCLVCFSRRWRLPYVCIRRVLVRTSHDRHMEKRYIRKATWIFFYRRVFPTKGKHLQNNCVYGIFHMYLRVVRRCFVVVVNLTLWKWWVFMTGGARALFFRRILCGVLSPCVFNVLCSSDGDEYYTLQRRLRYRYSGVIVSQNVFRILLTL